MCDIDASAEVWSETKPRSRRAWRCEECTYAIPVGTVHVHVSYLFEGSWTTFRAHTECRELALDVAEAACGERYWQHGEMRTHLSELKDSDATEAQRLALVDRWKTIVRTYAKDS